MKGIWITPEEIALLPTSGPAWAAVQAAAAQSTSSPDLSNQEDTTNVRVLAKALVFARTGSQDMRDQVVTACMAAIDTELGGRTLALGRELCAYVIAADLVTLPAVEDVTFRAWLRRCLTENLSGRTLQSTQEDRPNNWGTHSGASRAAVAVYLDDAAELNRTAQVFRGYLGDRSAYAAFSYGDLAWQANPSAPVGVNLPGTTIQGHSVDGVMPDDQRRAGGFTWPPPKENYAYEGLQGALVCAEILYRNGFPQAYEWQSRALLRAYAWLHEQAEFPAEGDDQWQIPLVNKRYGTSFPTGSPTSAGKNMAWTAWTTAAEVVDPPVETPPAILDFTPKSGLPGTAVVITGSGFVGVTEVFFEASTAEFQVRSASLIDATVPPEAESGPIQVVTDDDVAVSAESFTVTTADPDPPPPGAPDPRVSQLLAACEQYAVDTEATAAQFVADIRQIMGAE